MPRASKEAADRKREAERLRSAAHRAKNRFEYNAQQRKYNANNNEQVNEQRRLRYGADYAALAARPFIMWDGEGYTTDDGAHHYMLFGCSNDANNPLIAEDLSTTACLDYILEIERRYPDAFHVGFAFDYDVNMILKDLPSRFLRLLADYGVCHWQRYRIQYVPGKMFRITRGKDEAKITATIFDVFGFFHSSYVNALIKYGIATEAELARLAAGKTDRPNFTFADIAEVKKYWQEEISYGPPLMDCVRDACYDNGLFITQWHGPGALASYIMRKRGVKNWKSHDLPAEVQIAIQSAFAGGRFWPARCGLLLEPIYTADINSAYIYACSLLPRLDNGTWSRVIAGNIDREHIARFGLYHISFDAGNRSAKFREKGAPEWPYPLFHRDKHSNIRWPAKVDGWYWSPEAQLVADMPEARFLEAWVYNDDATYPFKWAHDEFNKRLSMQSTGNPAEKVFKTGLAAIYGACARTVGWDRKTRTAPPSHELAWAGYITSWCRAEMHALAYEVWSAGGLISIDTDGVTSSVPFKREWLARGVGKELGQWKLEEFTGILYWQSGFFWLRDAAGKWSTAKTRGFKRGQLSFDDAMEALNNAIYRSGETKHATIVRSQVKFVGFKEALRQRRGLTTKWRRWFSREWEIKMGMSNTSLHVPLFCRKCRDKTFTGMHVITHIPPHDYHSQPRKLPWLEEQLDVMPKDKLIINEWDEGAER
jgi:hypothetical protein